MRLKSLTIHNIASIEDAVIDFSGKELSDAPIFLICGETGAGKTTILDSICLALYGETPRMTSVSKEELETPDTIGNKNEKLYSNDNSQLLHRGAGEGYSKLVFEGNDGQVYEAIWEIHRAHYKAHKRLLRPTRQLKSINGSYFENRIWEIKGKVLELTGLSYDQFCRTVMLAQGEFTKFLKSNSAEKSEILEKLTGTEIYSKLGIKIAEKYNSLKSQCLSFKEEIDKVKILDDSEINGLKEREATQIEEINGFTKERELIDKKIGWLETSQELENVLKKINEDIITISACFESESFKEDKKLLKDYEDSAEGRVILNNINKTESLLKVKRDLFPRLQEEEDKAWEAEKAAVENGRELTEKIQQNESRLEKYNMDDLSKTYHRIVTREGVLSSIITILEKIQGEEKALSILEGQNAEIKDRINENTKKEDEIKPQLVEAEKDWKEWVEKLDKAELTISDMVKELRQQLHQGDRCPVCGTIVDYPLSDNYFESLLSPVKEAKQKSEERFLNLKSSLQAIEKMLKSDAKALKKLESKIIVAKESLEKARKESVAILQEGGMECLSTNDALTKSVKEKEGLRLEIKRIRDKQSEGEKITKVLKEQQKSFNEVKNKIDEIKDLVVKNRLAKQSLKSEIEAYEKSKLELEDTLHEFCEVHPSINTIEYLIKLAQYDAEDINDKRIRIETIENNLRNEKGKREAIENQIKSHIEKSPEFEENETSESLKDERSKGDVRIKSLSEDNGRIQETLKRDEEIKKELLKTKEQYDALREQLNLWNDLYDKLGDLKGVRFRSIAQSFILRSLLDNANIYMKCFNDRYTLTCNPGSLVILVKDSFNPGDAQPSSILSGGESFMASLSLALALSNLRSGGMSVDILFIDEGFGTLSADYLGNVMDTLEKLHQIGGRKVGLISHVAELKERIPVQIRVNRESPALSKVNVVENY